MGEVIPLRKEKPTVKEVLEHLGSRSDVQKIFVVTIDPDNEIEVYGSGDLSGISSAALMLNHYATQVVRRLVEDVE